MKKTWILLLILCGFAMAQRPYNNQRSGYAQNILWRDLHPSTQDSIRAAIADSLAALSADGVTIINDGTFKQKVFADTTALKLASADSVGMTVALKQISATNRSGGGNFEFADSTDLLAWFGTATPDGGVIIEAPIADRVWFRSDAKNGEVSIEWYGAKPNNDNTAAFQKALNLSEASVVSYVKLAKDTNYVSIANSVSNYACILVPSNVTIEGDYAGSVIARLPSERSAGTNGILIVTKYWDSAEGYEGSQNIVFQNFSITDGSSSPGQTFGDLIGIGHAQNVTITHVRSYNHFQHFVDIAGSQYVTIENCISNNSVTSTDAAVFQIDDASSSSSIWAINVDSTVSKNIKIKDNTIENSGATHIIHFHRGNTGTPFSDIEIINNHIVVNNTTNAVGKDSDTEIERLRISDNFFRLNNATGNTRAISLITNSTAIFRDVMITNNVITGVGQSAINLGQSSYANTTNQTGIVIGNNIINMDFGSFTGASQVIGVNLLGITQAVFSNNIMNINGGSTSNIQFAMYIQNCVDIDVRSNTFRILNGVGSSDSPPNGIFYQANLTGAAGIKSRLNIVNNDLYGGMWSAGIVVSGTGSVDSLMTGRISGNFVHDSVSVAHYSINYPLSDGTNNVHFVDFRSTGLDSNKFWLKVDTSDFIANIPIKYTVFGNGANTNGWRYEAWFYPDGQSLSIQNKMFSGVQYVQADSSIGLSIQDWRLDTAPNPDTNAFSVVTGNKAIAVTLNATTFKPQLIVKGCLKVRVGL